MYSLVKIPTGLHCDPIIYKFLYIPLFMHSINFFSFFNWKIKNLQLSLSLLWLHRAYIPPCVITPWTVRSTWLLWLQPSTVFHSNGKPTYSAFYLFFNSHLWVESGFFEAKNQVHWARRYKSINGAHPWNLRFSS